MKISKGEGLILLLAAVFLGFLLGWAARGGGSNRPLQVDAQWPTETGVVVITTPTPIPEEDKVNINTAGVEELQTVPGIGEKRARDIVHDREVNGPFRIPEDLKRVPGIGEGLIESISDWVTTGGIAP